VGEDRPVSVNVRVLAATHRDLAAMSADGSFREDLYYRLNVVQLHVPSLRERPEDIPDLTRHFIRQAAERFGVPQVHEPAGLMDALMRKAWPGNVRELKNAVEMMVALSADGALDLALMQDTPNEAPAPVGLRARVDAYERALLREALKAAAGNKAAAARALGIGRVTLYEKLAKHGF
jgi:two-component system response regulator HydG